MNAQNIWGLHMSVKKNFDFIENDRKGFDYILLIHGNNLRKQKRLLDTRT
jgi:hypothetical protein